MIVVYNLIKMLAIVTFFLPAFFIPFGLNVAVFYIFSIILFLTNILIDKRFINHLVVLYRQTPFKYLLYFFCWCFISGVLLVFTGKYPFVKGFIFYFIWTVCIVFFLTYLCPYIIFKSRIKSLIRIIIIANLITYTVGIIQYFGETYSISIIQNIINVLANANTFKINFSPVNSRMYGFFEEPGWFGFFIFINLTFIVNIFKSNIIIFKNRYINKILKRILLPMALICLILTKSPIWFIFNSILLLFNIIKSFNKKIVIVNLFIIFPIIIYIFYCFYSFSGYDIVEDTFLKRIVHTIQNFLNLDSLTTAEPSLASRIIYYIASFKLFLKNYILGTGLGYSKYNILSVFMQSNIPLTYEIHMNILLAGKQGMHIASAFLWALLSETGVFGAILFYYFVYKSIVFLAKLQKKLNGIVAIFNESLLTSLIAFVLVSWYDVSYTRLIVWFYLGITLVMYTYSQKNRIYIRSLDKNENS